MSICETNIDLITKTTLKRVNNALLVNDVWFFLAGLQDVTNFHAGEHGCNVVQDRRITIAYFFRFDG